MLIDWKNNTIKKVDHFRKKLKKGKKRIDINDKLYLLLNINDL